MTQHAKICVAYAFTCTQIQCHCNVVLQTVLVCCGFACTKACLLSITAKIRIVPVCFIQELMTGCLEDRGAY